MLAFAISDGLPHSFRFGIIFTVIVVLIFVIAYLMRSFFKN